MSAGRTECVASPGGHAQFLSPAGALPRAGDGLLRVVTIAALLLAGRLEGQTWRPVLSAAATASLAVDMGYTLAWQRHGGEEANPLLGAHPTALGLAAYNAAWAAANLWAPRKLRPWLNAATLLVECWAVRQNMRALAGRAQ